MELVKKRLRTLQKISNKMLSNESECFSGVIADNRQNGCNCIDLRYFKNKHFNKLILQPYNMKIPKSNLSKQNILMPHNKNAFTAWPQITSEFNSFCFINNSK